ncbi:MAG: NAD-dependent epimerase/dehydratase [Thermoleophilia bacterium]|nr:NAD-dependent epimerase/dehydratase [Thermoleophilia bacterium]
MSQRAVVTGGAGFIGSHLVDRLLSLGWDVHVVDDLSNGHRHNVPEAAPLHEVDVADANALLVLAESIGPIDRWYHFAAQADVRVSVEDPAFDARVNVIGTINVLQAAHRDAATVLLASTGGAIYGDAPLPTTEAAPTRPPSPYGTAKLAAEHYLAQHARLHGVRHAAVRFANVYGPRQDPHGEGGVVAIFGGKALAGAQARVFGDGRQTRDFVYVGDVVEASIAASDAAAAGTDAELRADGDIPIYNVGTGVQTSVVDLWSAMERAVGRDLGIEFADARAGEIEHSALDASLARRVLGVAIDTSVDTGVVATLDWLGTQVEA